MLCVLHPLPTPRRQTGWGLTASWGWAWRSQGVRPESRADVWAQLWRAMGQRAGVVLHWERRTQGLLPACLLRFVTLKTQQKYHPFFTSESSRIQHIVGGGLFNYDTQCKLYLYMILRCSPCLPLCKWLGLGDKNATNFELLCVLSL